MSENNREDGKYEPTNRSGQSTQTTHTMIITNQLEPKIGQLGRVCTSNTEVNVHLKWWLMNMMKENTMRGVSLTLFNPSHYLYTDASAWGWGATMGNMERKGHWTITEKTQHSNNRQMLAVIKAIKSFQEYLTQSV